MRRIQLVLVLFTVSLTPIGSHANAPPGRYQINAGTVYDTETKLTWQKTAATGQPIWTTAVANCQSLSLDGGGWRLPTMKELTTLVDETKNQPCIDASAFPATSPGYFWTSTPQPGDASRAWYVEFSTGETGTYPKDSGNNVRCVK